MQAGEPLPPSRPEGRGVFSIPRRWYRRYDLLLMLLSALMLFAWPKLWGNLTASGYMPHGHCYFWIPELVALHLVSDVLIGLAYVSISATLTYLVYRARRDIPFHWVFLAFGLFIVACGMTHWMEVWTIWNATYWLSGYVKLVTAVASVATAVVLPPLVPKTLELVRSAKLSEQHKAALQRANKELDDLRRREGRLAEERIARLAAIVESSRDAIASATLEGVITSWNRGAERLYGYSAEEAVGQHISMLFPPERRGEVREFLDRVGRGEGLENVETVRVAKDGCAIDVSLTLSPIRDPDGLIAGASTIARDITEQKRAERERAELLEREHAARKKAEEASRLRDEFLATVSHELRTPLTAILGWSHILQNTAVDSETLRNGIRVIRRNAERQGRIVEDLLDVSGIVAGKIRLAQEPVGVASVVREALEAVKLTAETKGVRVHVDVAPRLVILGDPDRLRQVMWNLLSNAVKFTPAGGEVRVTAEPSLARVKIEVSDTGEGIGPDFLPHVFDRFRQQDGSTTRRHGGLGLGLSIVRHLVEMHGGSVRAYSAGEGRGATVTVDLPLAAGADVPAPAEADAEGSAAGESQPTTSQPNAAAGASGGPRPLRGVRVLLVDDDEDTLRVIETFLRRGGAEVTATSSAAEALEAYERSKPDVLVADISMPEVDGYGLLSRVRSLSGEGAGATPAIALTAHAGQADRVRAVGSGFQAHLTKPVDPDRLLEVVAAVAGK